MGGKQGLCTQMAGAGGIFQNSPGDSHAVVGRGTAADFVQDQQTLGGGVFQNGCHFRHLHHKGGLAGGQIIAGADPGEHPVYKTDPGAAGGYEGAHLGHQHDQRHLAHISGFTGHIGTGDDGNLVVLCAQLGVVGDKQSVLEHLFHHRVAAIGDGYLTAQGDLWAAVAPLNGDGCQRAQHIRGGYGGSRCLHPGGLHGKMLPELGENLVFQSGEPLFGGEHLLFQLFQFRCDVALAVGQSLLADVVHGYLVDKGLGNFNVVTENTVVADFQRADAGLLPLCGLNGQNGAGAALHNIPQAVCLLVSTGTDDAALPDSKGRLVHDGVFDQIGAVGEGINGLFQLGKEGRFQIAQLPFYLRQSPEAPGKA